MAAELVAESELMMANYYYMKFHYKVLRDRKTAKLPDRLWRRYFELSAMSAEAELEGVLPQFDDILFELRLQPDELRQDLADLVETGLLETIDDGWSLSDFKEQQRPATSTERVQYFRERGNPKIRNTQAANRSNSLPGPNEPETNRKQTGNELETERFIRESKDKEEESKDKEEESKETLSHGSYACEKKPEPIMTDAQEETVRQIILDLHRLYDLSAEVVSSLGDEILQSVIASYPQEMISLAYQEAFSREVRAVGPYARAILTNWAETGPPQKGVYGDKNGPKGFGKGQRDSNGYTGKSAPGQGAISSLSGRSVDDPIKEIWDPKTGEEYHIDVRTGERVTESGEAIVIQ